MEQKVGLYYLRDRLLKAKAPVRQPGVWGHKGPDGEYYQINDRESRQVVLSRGDAVIIMIGLGASLKGNRSQ